MTSQKEKPKKAKVDYKPPTAGDVCFIRKGFGKWSSGTQVTIEYMVDVDNAVVSHDSTREEFAVPIDFLVRKRNRQE